MFASTRALLREKKVPGSQRSQVCECPSAKISEFSSVLSPLGSSLLRLRTSVTTVFAENREMTLTAPEEISAKRPRPTESAYTNTAKVLAPTPTYIPRHVYCQKCLFNENKFPLKVVKKAEQQQSPQCTERSMGTVPTVSPPSPSPSPTPSPTAYLPPHTDGAAPSRQPHPTAPPHLRRPHPAAPPTPPPSEIASRASPTAQYRPAPPSLQSAPPTRPPCPTVRHTQIDHWRPSLSSPPLPHTSRN